MPWMDLTRRVEICYRWSRYFYLSWRGASCLVPRSIHLVVVVVVVVAVVVVGVDVYDHSSLSVLGLLIHNNNNSMIQNEQSVY